VDAPEPLTVLALWGDSARATPHQRLAALLGACGHPPDAIANDTLGERNRRLMLLHDSLIGRPIEARVDCPTCHTANIFAIPVAEMLALPRTGSTKAAAVVRHGPRDLQFRLPTMADIGILARSDGGSGLKLRHAVLARCLLHEPAMPPNDATIAALDDGMIAAVEAAFDAADPLANIMVESACSDCGAAVAASVDIAQFVAADIDSFVAGLLRDIDMIASGYGWSEREIMALPARRRADYVAMIGSRRSGGAPRLVAGRNAA
jgi:hypothetical protein